jgi:proton-translocating NADH-quinone oxidoreductase chain N
MFTSNGTTAAEAAITQQFNWFFFGGNLPEWFLLFALVALLVHGVWFSTSPFLNYPSMVTNTLHHSFFLLCITLWLVSARFESFPSFLLFRSNLIYDDFSMKVSFLLILSTILCLLMSLTYLAKEKINLFEYVIFTLLSCLGGCWLVASYDFFTMYLTIELLSLPLYGLASIKSRSLLSTEAGLKYFLLGAFSSGVFLFGVSLIYLATGSLSFSEIGQLFAGVNVEMFFSMAEQGETHSLSYVAAFLMGMLLVMIGLLFKLTAVPFHMWAPDVYEGAPTPVTAYFSTVPKLAVFAVTVRIFYVTFFDISLEWQKAITLCAIGSMILGTLGAMVQKLDLKRLLAYSAIGNAGYILLGISAGNLEGLQGLLLFAVIYLVMSINAFATILTLRSSISTAEGLSQSTFHWEQDHSNARALFYQNSKAVTTEVVAPLRTDNKVAGSILEQRSLEQEAWLQGAYIPRQLALGSQNSLGNLKGILQFRTISKTNPLLAITIAFMFFSMAGVPPLAGFLGKMYLFFAAVNGGLYLAVFVAIITNVIGSFYYIRCIKLAYFDGSKEWTSLESPSASLSILLGASILFLSFFFLYPSTAILWVSNAAAVL